MTGPDASKGHPRHNAAVENIFSESLKLIDLPNEVLLLILACLPFDLVALGDMRRVCRKLLDVIDIGEGHSHLLVQTAKKQYLFAHEILGRGRYDMSTLRNVDNKQKIASEITQLAATMPSWWPFTEETKTWQSRFSKYLLLVSGSDQVRGGHQAEQYPDPRNELDINMLLVMRYVSRMLSDCTNAPVEGFRGLLDDFDDFTNNGFNRQFTSFVTPSVSTQCARGWAIPNLTAGFESCLLREDTLPFIRQVLDIAGQGSHATEENNTYRDITDIFYIAAETQRRYIDVQRAGSVIPDGGRNPVSYLPVSNTIKESWIALGDARSAYITEILLERLLKVSTVDGNAMLNFFNLIGEFESYRWTQSQIERFVANRMEDLANGAVENIVAELANVKWEQLLDWQLEKGGSKLRQSMPSPEDLLEQLLAASK